MKLIDIINELKETYPNATRYNFYYYVVFDDGIILKDEFVGVSSYHDGFLDTSEDPDGWSLEDEIEEYEVLKEQGELVQISLLLETYGRNVE